ncbi:uncharacterized protein [Maniola hyperantus]|uniref:uncharacterized protein n=1 Tax=Aphantopus hyperantus TaxID=2795564 RepID=UPI002145A7F2
MKSATILLMAMTMSSLFLESSTAPNPPPGPGLDDTVKIDESIKQEIYKAIESSDNALARAKQIIARAQLKPGNKDNLTEISAWLDNLEGISNQLHEEIKDAITTGSVKSIKKIIPEISNAIEQVNAAFIEYTKVLKGKIKAGFKKEIETIEANAAYVRDLLKNVIA